MLPFYVAAYEGRVVAIKRDGDYQVRVKTAAPLATASTDSPACRIR
jgi:hypothetical protein